MDEESPDFNDVDISDIEQEVDYLRPSDRERKKAQLQQEIVTMDDRYDGHDIPEEPNTVWGKYRVSPAIPNQKTKKFEEYKANYDRHVAWSNTKRIDNLSHLASIDFQFSIDRIAVLRHLTTEAQIREVASFQMARSNPEIGGFEAKMGSTTIRREDVDVRQTQNLPVKKKKKFFGFGGKKE